MRKNVVPAVVMLGLAAVMMAETPPAQALPTAENCVSSHYYPQVSPDIAALQARERSALARGDVAAARELEGQVQAVLIGEQHVVPQPVPVKAVKSSRTGANLAADQLIYAGGVNALSSDYEMDGTMWAAFAGADSAIRVYKSSDHGASWSKIQEYFVPPKHAIDKVELVVGQGDSGFVYVFENMPSSNGDLSAVRFDKDGTHLNNWGVLVGADTITDFTACRDFRDGYWLYAVAHNGLSGGDFPRSHVLRSTDYGLTWAVTDSAFNLDRPRLAFGAGECGYLGVVPRQNAFRGTVGTGVTTAWCSPGSWRFGSFEPDTFEIHDVAIAPAFTSPASNATVWVACACGSGDNLDVYAAYATDTLMDWNGPTVIANTGDAEAYVDLKNYTATGNDYVNLSYVDADSAGNGNAWLGYSNAGEPNVWSGLGSPWINQSGYVGRGSSTFPRIVYSPGGPGSGGGLIFAGQSGNGYFNGPWLTGVAEVKPARPAPAFSVIPSVARGPVRVSWSGRAQRLLVSDAGGRIVRSIAAPAGNSFVWDGKVPAGTYFVRLTTSRGAATRPVVIQ